MLPLINTNPNSNDGNVPKQISVLRNQMAQLRDAIEADLSNIRYDNLSPDLQKRIDNIDTLVTSSSEKVDMVAQSLAVNYATIKDLAAQTARINTIEASYITAAEVSANYASFGWVQALDAIVGTINADYVTTGQLNAVKIDASQITSGTINANRISANTFSSRKVECQGLLINGNPYGVVEFTINGTTYFCVGATGGHA